MMLTTPKVRHSTPWPAICVTLAAFSTLVYFLFFRPKPVEQKPPPAAVVQQAAVEAPRPVEIARPAPVVEIRKPLAAPVTPVSFTPPVRSAKSEVDDLIAEGKWRDARAKVAAAFSGPISDAERLELAQAGIRISQELLQNRADDAELYEIQQGDTLDSIAKKFKSLSGVKGAILYVNNYKENAILRAGRKVRIPKGTWSVVVDKSLFKEWVLFEGCPFKGYNVTIGAAAKETPVAKFTVGGKNPKPAWWPPADMKIKGPIPYGDPQNPLGEWWISLEHDLHHGIGIHGTNDPGSIGSKASNGCVRMLNEEVGEIAALAYKGMVVTVVE